jgi:uncharacterized protein DUF3298
MNSTRQSQNHIIIALVLFVLLACNATISIGKPTATIPVPTLPLPTLAATNTAIPTLISQQVNVIAIPLNEENQGPGFAPYKITAQTPQLTGSTDPRVQVLNQRLSGLVAKEVDTWRQSFQQSPVTPNSNGSSLDVKYMLVSQTGDLWSFKFDFDFYSDGAAHPGLNSITLNYDLEHGKELTLGDLFLPNSNYLEAIAMYCTNELSKQPFADPVFLEGTKPTPDNYRNWNIASDGLLITFDEYQVAPYAAGPQKVVVPYSALSSVINPQGPLAGIH